MSEKKTLPKDVSSLIKSLPNELKELLFKQWNAKQNPKWHPEGNTLKHILVVLKRAYHHYPNDPNMILAALFHDLGKIDTYKINPKTGQPTAYNHEYESTNYIDKFESWIDSFENTDLGEIKFIVKNHMKIKPKTWDVMKDTKKEPLMQNPSFKKLVDFTDKLDGGGSEIKKIEEKISKIKEMLKDDNKSLNEMGIDIKKLKKIQPNQYLFKTKNVDKTKEYYNEMKILEQKMIEIKKNIANMDWKDLKIIKKAHRIYSFIFSDMITKDLKNFLKLANKLKLHIELSGNLLDMVDDTEDFLEVLLSGDFGVYIELESNHRTHFVHGLPKSFKGINLGFKMYRKLLEEVGYINSDINASESIRKIYLQLIKDKDVNVIATKNKVLVILKKIPKDMKYFIFVDYIDELYSNWSYKYKLNKDMFMDNQFVKEMGVKNIESTLATSS